MSPTLSSQDKIIVNKLILGARIYTDFHFDRKELHCFRLPGYRNCQVGDIIVFNYPFGGYDEERIHFTINDVCVKRCVGLPGDTITIKKSVIYNSSTPINYHRSFVDSPSMEKCRNDNTPLEGSFSNRSTPVEFGISIKDYGPYVIPKKGLTMTIDSLMLKTYALPIAFENGNLPAIGTDYCFKENWVFVVGDNLAFSCDSRHFGPIPESYIIGVVVHK